MATAPKAHHKDAHRMDKRIVQILDVLPPNLPPTEPYIDYFKNLDAGMAPMMAQMFGAPPENASQGKEYTTTGVDKNPIRIKVYHPPQKSDHPQPCLVYLHGGGMALFSIDTYEPYLQRIAAFGLVVAAVNFRNSTVACFPAGVNDCLSGVLWTAEHAKDLNIDLNRLVVGGDSGGGNLTAATCLLAKEKGHADLIKGQYIYCPFLNPDGTNYHSRKNYDGYFIDSKGDKAVEVVYTPKRDAATDHLAYPSLATEEQLRGLPPALVVTNEFDPLVDEGEEYYAKLTRAGVRTVGLRVLGTTHGANAIGTALADVCATTHAALVGWINSLPLFQQQPPAQQQ